MGCPHTHFTRGRRVLVILKDGRKFVDRFIERKRAAVRLASGDVPTDQLRSMSAYRDRGG